jgi:hypothetical protein
MFVPFETLPGNARVWVYQSEKKLDDSEKKYILEKTRLFIDSWQSHGNDLKGSARIEYDHFLIISIDETFYGASGCSIDKSVHFVQELERELNISLLNRAKQFYLSENSIHFFQIAEARKLVTSGALSKGTKTFNNNILSKEELETDWIVPVEKSWLGKFFQNNN